MNRGKSQLLSLAFFARDGVSVRVQQDCLPVSRSAAWGPPLVSAETLLGHFFLNIAPTQPLPLTL